MLVVLEKLHGAETDSLWNLHNGGRKWLIHLKIEDIRECWRILEMYYCGFEKEKYKTKRQLRKQRFLW